MLFCKCLYYVRPKYILSELYMSESKQIIVNPHLRKLLIRNHKTFHVNGALGTFDLAFLLYSCIIASLVVNYGV